MENLILVLQIATMAVVAIFIYIVIYRKPNSQVSGYSGDYTSSAEEAIPGEILAVIAAAIASMETVSQPESGADVSLRVKAVRRVGSGAWGSAGRKDLIG